MKKNNWIIIGVILLLISALAIIGQTTGLLSVITQPETQMLGISCTTSQSCYNSLIAEGFSKTNLDEELQDTQLVCINNECGAVRQ